MLSREREAEIRTLMVMDHRYHSPESIMKFVRLLRETMEEIDRLRTLCKNAVVAIEYEVGELHWTKLTAELKAAGGE